LRQAAAAAGVSRMVGQYWLAQSGGVRTSAKRPRPPLRLSLEERETISRGLVEKLTLTAIPAVYLCVVVRPIGRADEWESAGEISGIPVSGPASIDQSPGLAVADVELAQFGSRDDAPVAGSSRGKGIHDPLPELGFELAHGQTVVRVITLREGSEMAPPAWR
jgi:hypothetical protein